jgi:hypothetical protein
MRRLWIQSRSGARRQTDQRLGIESIVRETAFFAPHVPDHHHPVTWSCPLLPDFIDTTADRATTPDNVQFSSINAHEVSR